MVRYSLADEETVRELLGRLPTGGGLCTTSTHLPHSLTATLRPVMATSSAGIGDFVFPRLTPICFVACSDILVSKLAASHSTWAATPWASERAAGAGVRDRGELPALVAAAAVGVLAAALRLRL